MSHTKHFIEQETEKGRDISTDAQYDAEYLEFLRDLDLQRRMSEEAKGTLVLFDNSDLRRRMEKL